MICKKNEYYVSRFNCPVCNSEDHSILLSIQRESDEFINFLKIEPFYTNQFHEKITNLLMKNATFEIVQCKRCSFIFQSEILNEMGMEKLYNEWLDQDKLVQYYTSKGTDKTQESTLQILKKYHFKKCNEINVLDYGAGYGGFCTLSSKLGLNTYAFDLSEEKNRYLASSLDIKIIKDIDQYKSYFDFIHINQVLEHLADPAEILSKLHKTLKNTGIIFISVPNCKSVKTVIKKQGVSPILFKQLSPHQHINAFNNRSLKLLSQNNGLKSYNILNFIKYINFSLSGIETLLLLKYMKHSLFGTSLFFSKKI